MTRAHLVKFQMRCALREKYPYLPLYTGDYLKDPQLSMCSPITRGIWVDFLCAMHECGRSGRVTGTVEQLSRIGRCTTAEIRLALDELKATRAGDVSERNGVVTVVNRRMQREDRERLLTRERVAKHRSNGKKTEDKRQCNADVLIDSDVEIKQEEIFLKEKKGKRKAKSSNLSADAQSVFDHWRATMGHPDAKPTAKRVQAVNARLAEGYSVADLCAAVDGCKASPFYQGQNDRHEVYDDLELICRNGEKVEKFKAVAGGRNGTTNGIGGPQAIAGSLPSESGSGGRWAAREF